MGDKDPPPFGYTFSGFFDGNDASPYDNSQSLLTENETQSIADFFSNTDPFHLNNESLSFAAAPDTKDSNGLNDYNNWSNFVTPATVHGVSTTIPDQAQLTTNFFGEQSFVQPSLPSHLGNTHDDLQAAETLFTHSQSQSQARSQSHSQPQLTFAAPRSQSFSGISSSSRSPALGGIVSKQHGKPLVATPYGYLAEQLAVLLPNHTQDGTIDAQLAAEWAASNLKQVPESELGEILDSKPPLKRSYTFGTDDSFNLAGYAATHGPEPVEHVVRHALRVVRPPGAKGIANTGPIKELSDDEQSDDATSDDDDDDQPAKKRRKSKATMESARKPARGGKHRKGSIADDSSKKKRTAASQKIQRENLTEEQKRSNHILSEQKRRNLIKRGFDDLHDLVPEIRNGGLSKSSVLMEAGNFLEKIIQDNIAFTRILAG